nr:immunoglobulin heavy chain junction region [Macaca mulatta]
CAIDVFGSGLDYW